jgi:lysophospholipase L1-like esterase
LFAKEFAKDVLKGKVEAVNLGVPASNTATTLISLRRFLPKMKPQIVVLYHGFNDVVYYRARAEATRRLLAGKVSESDPAIDVRAPSQGLWQWLFGTNSAADRALDLEGPTKNYEEMSRLSKELGFSLYLSTFASPSYENIEVVEKRYFEAEIRHLWPPLVNTARYTTDLQTYNERIRELSGRLSTGLIDVAKGVRGGRAIFRDNCHLNESGREVHANVVFAALLPEVRRLLDKEQKVRQDL